MGLFGPGHYDYLEANLMSFFKLVGIDTSPHNNGMIVAHGDKAYGFKYDWNQAEIPFERGVAIYLLSYCSPFNTESRETENGWVDVGDWVRDNYERFEPYLVEAERVNNWEQTVDI